MNDIVLPSIEELSDLILRAIQTLGVYARRQKINREIATLDQIPRDLTPSKQRKMKYRFNRSLAELEKDGLVRSLNDIWSLTDKGKKALNPPDRVTRYSAVYVRDLAIRAAVMKRAKGKCEFCGEPGFMRVDGTPYLECHHIIALANDGVDRMTNVIALCANHHREAHFGERRDQIEEQMTAIVSRARAMARAPLRQKAIVQP